MNAITNIPKLSQFDIYMAQSKAQLMRIARLDHNLKGTIFADPLSNPKVAKNAKFDNVLTYPIHLAPSTLSGFNTCAMASDGCKEACLHTAGNPAYMKGKNSARITRTKLYFENRPLFVAILCKEVISATAKAAKLGMALAFRPNATSDIKWEKSKVISLGMQRVVIDLIHQLAPEATIYDYTKEPNRETPSFYTLTFSLSENNDIAAYNELLNGRNVAVVFDTKRGQALPKTHTLNGKVFEVIDGDKSDYRPEDIQGVIVGLRAKGDAIGDSSGFVRKANQSVFMAA
tara:strand:+ start:2894 stop:3757 length:864 start_codon:yes stop_codon:yes gene_type:complete